MATSNGARTSPYDRAMALCPTEGSRLELSRLGAELNLGASSPEWIIVVLYAEARGIFSTDLSGDRRETTAQLNRIEAAVQRKMASTKKPEPGMAEGTRYLIVVALTLLVCVAVAVVTGVAQVTFVALIASFALGISVALGYIWLRSDRAVSG